MRVVLHDPPPLFRSLADRCSSALAEFDAPVNRLHDSLNRSFPRLWWPLVPPAADRRLAGAEHGLYVVHAALGLGVVFLAGGRRSRPLVVVGGTAVAAVSWAVFSGAWDRRADDSGRERRAAGYVGGANRTA